MESRKLTDQTRNLVYAIALSLLVVLGVSLMAAIPAPFGVFGAVAAVSFAVAVGLSRKGIVRRTGASRPPTARKVPKVK